MSQTDKLYSLLSDYQPKSTPEILERVYGGSHLGIARISARIYDVKNKYSVQIDSFPDKEKDSIYWYQMKRPLNERNLFET